MPVLEADHLVAVEPNHVYIHTAQYTHGNCRRGADPHAPQATDQNEYRNAE